MPLFKPNMLEDVCSHSFIEIQPLTEVQSAVCTPTITTRQVRIHHWCCDSGCRYIISIPQRCLGHLVRRRGIHLRLHLLNRLLVWNRPFRHGRGLQVDHPFPQIQTLTSRYHLQQGHLADHRSHQQQIGTSHCHNVLGKGLASTVLTVGTPESSKHTQIIVVRKSHLYRCSFNLLRIRRLFRRFFVADWMIHHHQNLCLLR